MDHSKTPEVRISGDIVIPVGGIITVTTEGVVVRGCMITPGARGIYVGDDSGDTTP